MTQPTESLCLAGRTALITGAARGIGLATVQLLSARGARIVAFDVPGANWIDALAIPSLDIATFEGDVGNAADWERVIALTQTRFGRLDILVNNAGVSGAFSPLVDYPDDEFDRVMHVNARGVFLGLKHGARAMKGGPGSIINVSSVSGIGGGRFIVAYTASKHAVVGMTKLAAAELAPEGIRVNAICPSPTSTEMMFSLERTHASGDPEAIRRGMTRMIPMGRYAEPGEIAQVVLFFASDASSFMTGTAVPVDGGLKAA